MTEKEIEIEKKEEKKRMREDMDKGKKIKSRNKNCANKYYKKLQNRKKKIIINTFFNILHLKSNSI